MSYTERDDSLDFDIMTVIVCVSLVSHTLNSAYISNTHNIMTFDYFAQIPNLTAKEQSRLVAVINFYLML